MGVEVGEGGATIDLDAFEWGDALLATREHF